MDILFIALAIISGTIVIQLVFEVFWGIGDFDSVICILVLVPIFILLVVQVPYAEMVIAGSIFANVLLIAIIRFFRRKVSATSSVKWEKEAIGTAVLKNTKLHDVKRYAAVISQNNLSIMINEISVQVGRIRRYLNYDTLHDELPNAVYTMESVYLDEMKTMLERYIALEKNGEAGEEQISHCYHSLQNIMKIITQVKSDVFNEEKFQLRVTNEFWKAASGSCSPQKDVSDTDIQASTESHSKYPTIRVRRGKCGVPHE